MTQNLVTKMECHIKKSRFSVKPRCKESKWVDGGHSLNRDFTVYRIGYVGSLVHETEPGPNWN